VVALKAIQSKDDLMMITANGIIIRTGLEQIRSIGRNTQGVRLIKLKGGDKLVAAEKIVSGADVLQKNRKTGSSGDADDSKEKPNTNRKSKSKPQKKSSKRTRKSR